MSEDSHPNGFYDSDSFISDDQEIDNARKKMSSQPITKIKREKNTKQIYTGSTKAQRNNNKRSLNRPFNAAHVEVTTQRILSARNHKISDQSNAIHHLTLQIEELKNENKTLKTQFIRQEKALNKIDTKQIDFPKILEQHEAEVLSLKELLRRSKDSLSTEIKQRKECDNEILKLRDSLAKANQLIGDKNLDQRSSLQSQINDLQTKLETKEKYLETSTKHIEYLEKTHKREIYSMKKQMQKYLVRCQDLENELELTKNNLREKEKLLEIQNIYSHRFKNSHRTIGSSGQHSDQLLDKLDLNSLSHKDKNETDLNSKIISERHSERIDTGKIKEDIRKIVEEEIISGRIKPFEIYTKAQTDQTEKVPSSIVDKNETHDRVTMQDNTELSDDSEIFDRDPPTQVESEIEQPIEANIDLESLERDRSRRQLILNKLNDLDIDDSSKLMYSYPNDNNYLTNEEPVSEIETIASTTVQSGTKMYKFSSTIDSLHNGVPVHSHSRGKEDMKSTTVNRTIKMSDQDVSRNQRNNSNSDASIREFSADDKKRKESQLLSELFGSDFTPQPVVHGRPYPSGTRQSRAGSLPWENEEQGSRKATAPMLQPNYSSGALNESEDIEQIVL